MLATESSVVVWADRRGMPERLVWAGRRWRVSDTPTALDIAVPLLTHPPAIDAWRFQGTTEDGAESRVFDVVHAGTTWHVIRTWE